MPTTTKMPGIKNNPSPELAKAIKAWPSIAPLFDTPVRKKDVNALYAAVDVLVDHVGDDENHPLAGFLDALSDRLEAYENEHVELPDVDQAAIIRYLLDEHGLTQSELPEIGTQSVVSETLAGKRELNTRQIAALCKRFHLSPAVFFPNMHTEAAEDIFANVA